MEHQPTRHGIGFFTLLGTIFVVLKLTGLIGWSWWWVLMPFYLPFVVAMVVCVIMGAVFLAIR